MNQVYEAARTYLDAGLCPIPLEGKRPLVTWKGYQERRPDNSELWEMFGEHPKRNIGLVCGRVSRGLLVLDWDDPEAYEEWKKKHLDLSTSTVQTGGGGYHTYYRLLDGGDGLGNKPFTWEAKHCGEIRFDGGLVVAPPSVHPDTGSPYEWLNGEPILEIAAWGVLDLELGTGRRRLVPDRRETKIEPGDRNTWLTSVGGSLRRQGLGEEALFVALREANTGHCEPPLPETEVRGIARSLARYASAVRVVEDIDEHIHLTDVGNGRRLAQRHGDRIRYVTVKERGYWAYWDGRRWVVSSGVEMDAFAKDTVARMYAEASRQEDESHRKNLAAHAIRSEQIARIRAMIDAAASEPGISVHISKLDQEPWLLNCQNGTLDLRTGLLREHDPNDLLTMATPTEYDGAVGCPRWLQFLDEIMDGKDELVNYLQRFLGYCLSGDTREDMFMIAHGSGCNGKTTCIETIRAVLGPDYSQQAPVEMLLRKRPGRIPADIARLRGARFVSASEIGQGRRLDEQMVKHLTGHDTISARHLYGEWFEFQPTHKIIIATNHRPIIRETSLAMWRRPHLVPFTVTFSEKKQDKNLLHKLVEEAPGILAWMVDGCLAWQRDGLSPPAEVRQATEEYRNDMDIVGRFIADRCEFNSSGKARAGQLYDQYEEWAKENGERAMSSRAFSEALIERGLERDSDKQGRFYKRIELRISRTVEG